MLKITLIGALIFFSTPIKSQGYNGCADNTWIYHSHTHTCIKWVRISASWQDAQTHCRTFMGGTEENIPGRLARIDDQETNDFISFLLLKATWTLWIGLHYVASANGYRWDGFPDEIPVFMNLPNPQQSTSYCVRIDGDLRWTERLCTGKPYFFCQHDARIEKTQISCSTAPIEESATLPILVTSQFHFNHWDTIDWYIDGNNQAAASCSESTNTCTSNSVGYVATVTGSGLATLSFSGSQTSRPESTWTFKISHQVNGEKQVDDTKSCTGLVIYAKPSPLKCSVLLLKSGIQVACETDRVFPQASWEWSYKNEADASFFSVDQSQINPQQDTSFTDSQNGNLYYRSKCSVTLTPDKTTIRTGRLTVQIHVYPNISGNSLAQIPEVKQMKEEIINIVPPEKPTFRSANKALSNSDPLPVVVGDTFTLECRVDSGTPEVMSTHVDCGFPFLESGGSTDTTPGTSYSMTFTVNTSMNGKTCRCWGHHISGDTEKALLTFSVRVPASVNQFTANGQKRSEVAMDTQVNILCQTAGNPTPVTTLLKEDSNNAVKALQVIEGVKVEKNFQAKCSHNGRYFCQTHNTIHGTVQESRDDLSLRVRCLPTLCEKEGQNPEKTVSVGQPFELTMCVDGYPLPVLAKFKLQKETGDNTWNDVNLPSDAIAFATDGHALKGVIVKFGQLRASQTGQYRLLYQGDDVSTLSFTLSEQKRSSTSGVSIGVVVGIAVATIVIIVIIVIFIAAFVLRRLRGKESKNEHRRRPTETGSSDVQYVTDQEEYVDIVRLGPNPNHNPKAEAKKANTSTSNETAYEGEDPRGDDANRYESIGHMPRDIIIEAAPEDFHYDILHPN